MYKYCLFTTAKEINISLSRHRHVLHLSYPVCLILARQPPVCQGVFIHEVSRPHTTMHHSQEDSSGWVISSSHRPHKRQTSMPPVGFEPTISAGERPLGPAILLNRYFILSSTVIPGLTSDPVNEFFG